MLADRKVIIYLLLNTQLKVDQKQNQNIPTSHKLIKQVCWFKTLKGLHPGARYDVKHCKCRQDDDVVTNKRSKTRHKRNGEEFKEDVAVEELTNSHIHRTKNQNLSTSNRKH